MAVDWSRGDISHRLSVQLLDPVRLTVRGEVDGVVADGEVSLDYYSDTRASARISLVAPIGKQVWDGTAAMRLIRTTWDYTGVLDTAPLGTFLVKPDADAVSWSDDGDMRTWEFDLVSILYGTETQVLTRPLALGKGAKALDTVKARLKNPLGRTPTIAGNAKNYSFTKTVEYDAGTSELSVMLDLLDKAGDRLTVDEYGTINIGLYTAPSKLGATYSVDSSDPRTLLVGPVNGGVARQAVPERVTIAASGSIQVDDGEYKRSGTRSDGSSYSAGDPKYKSEQKTYYADAQAKSGHWSTHAIRGYTLDDFQSISDMEPFTQAQAQKLANAALAEHQNNIMESLSHSLRYMPLRAGDIELLTHAGETRRWQVASADLDLSSWVWRLQLKGGWK